MQLVDLRSGLVQDLSAGGGDPIDSAAVSADILEDGLQEPAAFEAVEQGVERSRADAIPVMRQLLHHGEAEDGLVRRMQEHMDPYQSDEEFALVTGHPLNITSFILNRMSIV